MSNLQIWRNYLQDCREAVESAGRGWLVAG